MLAINNYTYLGFMAFIILVIGLLFVVVRWPQGKHLTFSQHVAKRKSSILYYIALFSVTLPLLLLFFIGWFVPMFDLPVWFTVFLVISCITQYVCTLIPETGGWKTTYHRLLSGASGICLIPLLVILLFTPTISVIDKSAVLCGLAVIASVLYVVMSRKKERYEPSYVYQAIFYAGFFVPILVISYI